MKDREKDLRILCDQVSDDFLKNQDIQMKKQFVPTADEKEYVPTLTSERQLVFSKPYVRKCNLTSDRSLTVCWEQQLRFPDYDLYVSIMRRSYIPPVMDMYQDIVTCSKFNFDTPQNGGELDEL